MRRSLLLPFIAAAAAIAAPAEAQRGPRPFNLPNVSFPAGTAVVCVSWILYREANGLTVASARFVDQDTGQGGAITFNAQGGQIRLNTPNAVIPVESTGWPMGQKRDVLDLLAAAAVARQRVTIQYGASTEEARPINTVQVTTSGTPCA